MRNFFGKFVLAALPIAVVDGLFFYVLGTEHSMTRWISFGFLNLAYVSVLFTPLFARSSKIMTNKASLWYISSWYFFLELIPAITCIWVNPEDYRWPLIVQALLYVVFVFWFILTYMVNDHINQSLAEQKAYSTRINILASRLQGTLRDLSGKPELYEVLNKTFHKMQACPVKSCAEIKDIEEKIADLIEQIEQTVEEGNEAEITALAKKLNKKIDERNTTLKFIH